MRKGERDNNVRYNRKEPFRRIRFNPQSDFENGEFDFEGESIYEEVEHGHRHGHGHGPRRSSTSDRF